MFTKFDETIGVEKSLFQALLSLQTVRAVRKEGCTPSKKVNGNQRNLAFG